MKIYSELLKESSNDIFNYAKSEHMKQLIGDFQQLIAEVKEVCK